MEYTVAVGIPVGPRPGHRQWLNEALASCMAQTLRPEQVIIVTDGSVGEMPSTAAYSRGVAWWHAPWRIGPAAAFNCAVGLAAGADFVFFLASDDTLEPQCLERCMAAAQASPDPLRTIVYAGVRYMNDGHVQHDPCGAMMVPVGLWREIGGYPLETAVGAQDFLLWSALQNWIIRNPGCGIRYVPAGPEPLYNYRTHPDTENEMRKPWWPIVEAVHRHMDQNWRPDPC